MDLELLEKREIIDKLVKRGFGELVKALMDHEHKVYTKKGRLNKSGACRVLGWKTKQLEDALAACRQILCKEFED